MPLQGIRYLYTIVLTLLFATSAAIWLYVYHQLQLYWEQAGQPFACTEDAAAAVPTSDGSDYHCYVQIALYPCADEGMTAADCVAANSGASPSPAQNPLLAPVSCSFCAASFYKEAPSPVEVGGGGTAVMRSFPHAGCVGKLEQGAADNLCARAVANTSYHCWLGPAGDDAHHQQIILDSISRTPFPTQSLPIAITLAVVLALYMIKKAKQAIQLWQDAGEEVTTSARNTLENLEKGTSATDAPAAATAVVTSTVGFTELKTICVERDPAAELSVQLNGHPTGEVAVGYRTVNVSCAEDIFESTTGTLRFGGPGQAKTQTIRLVSMQGISGTD